MSKLEQEVNESLKALENAAREFGIAISFGLMCFSLLLLLMWMSP